MENLFIMQLNSPANNWENVEVRSTFNKMVELRLAGYRKYHHQFTLPVDTVDFIADHLFICRKLDIGFEILLCVKSITKRVAGLHQIGFTPEVILKNEKASEKYFKALDEIIKESESLNKEVGYYSSWTMKEGLSADERAYLKDIFAGISKLYHQESHKACMFGFGIPKYKTDLYFQSIGFEKVKFEGEELPNISASLLGGIDSVFIVVKDYSEYGSQMATRFKKMWGERRILGEAVNQNEKQVGA